MIVVPRVGYRLFSRASYNVQELAGGNAVEKFLASTTHVALYGFMTIMPATGVRIMGRLYYYFKFWIRVLVFVTILTALASHILVVVSVTLGCHGLLWWSGLALFCHQISSHQKDGRDQGYIRCHCQELVPNSQATGCEY